MGKINRLPPELANQIAAGEVVERPASVVKELVENAIDAGARRLSIHVELGGKKQVRVEDDGEGMDPEDARLAIERHATSKIRRVDDLGAIVSSVKKTGRCVVVHEATLTSGFGAELSTLVQESCFYHLEAPVVRVAGWDTPYPHAQEWDYFPGPQRVGRALKAVLEA